MPEIYSLVVMLFLVGLNIMQFVYWSKIVGQLTDKLMSRNFYEYKHTTQPALVPSETVTIEDDQIEESDILNQLNSMVR